jgi:tetratricopeptide (TPR) repeat protein
LTIDPNDVAALEDKGNALSSLDKYSEAIEYYDKALAIQPNDTYALNSKGNALSNLGNYTGAIDFYGKTLAIDPNNTFALTNKDAILHMLGNNTTSGNATNFQEYDNSTYGIKMQYPSDWQVEGAGNSSSIVASFNPQRNYASYVTIQIENLSIGYTPDQYLNSLMLGDEADDKDFPDIKFTQNTTNNIVVAGHPGYLLNGTFRDPTSDGLQRFTNIGTIIGDKVYSVIYYSPAETYSVYRTIYDKMIKSFEVIPQKSSAESTYVNSTYGIRVQYPSDWTIQESNATGTLINIATFVSPTGSNFNPTADIAIYMDKLHNSTTNLDNYAQYSLDGYKNFSAFKLLRLNTNSTLARSSAYTIIGTYEGLSSSLQKLIEVGTIIGDKAYIIQYIADASKYFDYLPIVQKMIDSMQITSQGNGPYGMTMGPNGTMTVTNGNITGTLTAPPGSKINNFTIIPEPSTPSLNPMGLDNTTWSLLNESSGQMGTIKFHS